MPDDRWYDTQDDDQPRHMRVIGESPNQVVLFYPRPDGKAHLRHRQGMGWLEQLGCA